eukprot:CAMPEP_0114231102 /NCGR_PEP_ID=MMETSP0058-20121206/3842_1 /TAXON_ID=36894 /ORGANISM="Pyramimonas parkeae, CCMP726" /LENGTH=165 /DNA_ID=CAMNT_0001342383 /DNA_START=612 /DNA_END=1108 /DNA_ORIENTATION=+
MTPVEMTLALALRGGGVASSSAAMTGHYTLNEVSSEPMPTLASGSLKDVVNNAKQRWFHEALELAQSGDCRQMALLAEMLAEGYGCEKDPTAAKYWTEQAKKGRAYRDGGLLHNLAHCTNIHFHEPVSTREAQGFSLNFQSHIEHKFIEFSEWDHPDVYCVFGQL